MLTFGEHSPDCCLFIINMPFYKALYLHSTSWISFHVSTCQLLKMGLLSQRLCTLYMLIHIAKQLSKYINLHSYQKCKTFTSLANLLNLWQFGEKEHLFLALLWLLLIASFHIFIGHLYLFSWGMVYSGPLPIFLLGCLLFSLRICKSSL